MGAVPQEVCQVRKVQQASHPRHSQRTSDTTLLPALLRASIQHKWVFPWVIRGHSYSRGHRKARGRGEGSVGEGGEGQEGGRCPCCEMKAYPEDSVTLGDFHYHKACLKCAECGRGPDNDTPMMLGPKDQDNVFGEADLEPYCKFCFAKRYKVSALNIAETVTTLLDQGSMSL